MDQQQYEHDVAQTRIKEAEAETLGLTGQFKYDPTVTGRARVTCRHCLTTIACPETVALLQWKDTVQQFIHDHTCPTQT